MEETKRDLANCAPPVVRRRSKGKKKLPVDRRRVVIAARVLPATLKYLDGMGYASTGLAVDAIVKAVQHPGIVAMLEAGGEVGIVNLAAS